MKNFDEHNLTDAVIASMEGTPDPRLKHVLSSLVRHLHDFVRDVALTPQEWDAAIAFLTRTGKTCNEHRQEFILLSDTLGVSMLVDAINHHKGNGSTETTVLGPFYVQDAPALPNGSDISNGFAGQPLLFTGRVISTSGVPVANATVDVWHADDQGFYDVQQSSGFAGRARLRTDANGELTFWSVMPRWYPIPDDGPVGDMLKATKRHPNRPAHVHFMIASAGFETLVTHLFSDDSPYLDSDAVFGVKNSLILNFETKNADLLPGGRHTDKPHRQLQYEFVLQAASV